MPRHSLVVTALVGGIAGAAIVAWLPASSLFLPAANPLVDAAASQDRWACPMLCFIAPHPGSCPVCGMTMERMTADKLTHEQQARMEIETVTVTQGPAVVTVRAAGTATYDHRYTTAVISRVAGRIVKRHGGDAARHTYRGAGR